jgi:ribonuclease HI
MYFDGSLNIDGAGAGVLFISPTNDHLRYVLRIYFPACNNAVEYEAYLHDMRIAVKLGVKCLYIYGDSALVINQLNKDWDTLVKRWMCIAKKSKTWKANSMASSTPMWSGTRIKQLTSCLSWGHPELKSHMAYSSKTLSNHPSRKKQIRWSRSL